MSLPELFIRRPIMTTLVMAAILIAGVMGYRQLPVNDLPVIDFPTINVNANLPGASPETMASSVATTLERQFSTIPGLDSMTSSNSQGGTNITLQFSLDRDIDAAAQDVQTAIAQSLGRLPDGMPNPPSYRKSNPADAPILMIALSSETLPRAKVNEYAETYLAQQISSVKGVAQVQVFGSQKYAVRVQINPRELASRSIGINQVADAIRNGNVNLPTGTLDGEHRSYTVEASGQLRDAAAYRDLIVEYRAGQPVRLSEVANVIDSVENRRSMGWYGDDQAVVLAVNRLPNENTIATVDAIRKMLPAFQETLPAMMHMEILLDRSESIRASVEDVKVTMLITIGLVILVIFFFLRSLATTIIPSLALPMSIVGTFAFMQPLHFSVDNFSLMALTLSIGFVVDDAIVMLENIVRHREMGKDAMTAARDGSREVSFTILSMTLSLVAVFIPVLFMGGILGRLLHEFAVTISIAIVISGFVSLSLTPMLCARFRGLVNVHQRHGRIYNLSERFFNLLLWAYEKTLLLAMRARLAVLLAAFGLIYATYALFNMVPKGFLPNEDINQLQATTEAAQGVSFDSMMEHQLALNKIVAQEPNVEAFSSNLRGGNSGQIIMRLRDRGRGPGKRQKTVEEVIQDLQPKLAEVPGIRTYLRVPPPIQIGSRNARALYQFTLQGSDFDELYRASDEFMARVAASPGFVDVNTDLQIRNPQVDIDINRDKASSLGLTARQIEDALYTAYGTRLISTIYRPEDAYNVVLELDDKYQRDPSALPLLYIATDTGEFVSLDSFATLSREVGPLSINHSGQLPSVTISFNLAPGMALGDGVNTVRELARETLPGSIQTSFQGTAQVFESSLQGIMLLLLMAVVVIYIVLGILYESFLHPITILSGLPSAAVGALLTLKLFNMELNLYGFVGILLLVGIVKKNAIMMIDFALDAQRNEGKTAHDAIVQGCLVRFRPILMTTMAAMMGGLPIALGLGAGAEARRPLGLAIVGGLLFSQLVTLYITPVIFTYLESLHGLVSSRKRASNQQDTPPTEPIHAGAAQ